MENKKISELFAWVSTAPDGTDEVPAKVIGDQFFPLFAYSRTMAERMKPLAQDYANKSGLELRLVKSLWLRNVDRVEPQSTKETVSLRVVAAE